MVVAKYYIFISELLLSRGMPDVAVAVIVAAVAAAVALALTVRKGKTVFFHTCLNNTCHEPTANN